MNHFQSRIRLPQIVVAVAILGSVPRCGLGQTLLEPHKTMPRYVLSNPRFETSRQGNPILVIDFERQGDVAPKIAVDIGMRMSNSSEIKKVFGPQPFASQAGRFRIGLGQKEADRMRSEGAELFVMHELISASRAARSSGNFTGTIEYRFKSSNSVTVGSAKAVVKTRAWNAEEQRRVESWLKFSAPVPLPSAEYVFPSKENPAVPGMPAMAYQLEAWKPCEIIGVESRYAKVRFDPATEVLSTVYFDRLAVLRADVAKAQADLTSFTPSIALVPGTMDPLPKDYEVVKEAKDVAVGTRVKAVVGDELVDAEVYEIWADRYLKVRVGTGVWGREYTLRPQYVYIAKAGTTAEMASRPAQNVSATPPTSRRLTRYKIVIPLPPGHARVDLDTPLEPGMKLGCSYARKWEPITLVKVYDDGTIRCAWDKWANVERDMSREDVIIATALLKKVAPEPVKKQPTARQWTDITGKFKIEATFAGLENDKVTLIKADGSKVTIEITKLSLEDQKLARELARSP